MELQKEIKIVQTNVKQLQEKQEQHDTSIQLLLSKTLDLENEDNSSDTQTAPKESPNDFLCLLQQITSRKYVIKIKIHFDNNFEFNVIVLFDTGADLNCIKEGIVPKRFQTSTLENLSAANNSKLHINNKCDAIICNQNCMIKTSFLIAPDINHMVILGTPFISLITPYTVNHNGISFEYLQNNLIFSFIDQPHT